MVAVDGNSIGSVDQVTIRSSDGTTMQFNVERLDVNTGLPAVHLREHLASGVPVVIEYVVEGGGNVALRYNDAPPAPSS